MLLALNPNQSTTDIGPILGVLFRLRFPCQFDLRFDLGVDLQIVLGVDLQIFLKSGGKANSWDPGNPASRMTRLLRRVKLNH